LGIVLYFLSFSVQSRCVKKIILDAALNQVRSGGRRLPRKGRRMVRLLPERGKQKLKPEMSSGLAASIGQPSVARRDRMAGQN
jgi:hypothetical protein